MTHQAQNIDKINCISRNDKITQKSQFCCFDTRRLPNHSRRDFIRVLIKKFIKLIIEMSLPTIERFLFILELEAAGIILGWLSIIGFGALFSFLSAVAWINLILGNVIQPQQNVWHQIVLSI